jgi:glyoxylase-like metal-dependent hydrolase (beta-lactamase superfamily II)
MNDLKTPTRIHTLELGPMENFVYLIEDIKSKRTAVVDPAWEPTEILALAKQQGLNITDILLTHSHYDHINAIDNILEEFDAQLHLTHAEAQFWGQAGTHPSLHHGGDRISMGETVIEVLHTPGHTPGSACYKVLDHLITGDTMFVFGCGRCDMAGGDPNQMYETLNKIKLELPATTEILPGHNYAVKPTASLKEQIDGNPFMHFKSQDDFVKFRMQLHGKVRQSPYAAVSESCAHDWLAASD